MGIFLKSFFQNSWTLAGFLLFLFSLLIVPGSIQASLVTNASLKTPNLQSGLVGWWTFDGPNMKNNVADSSGSGNNGSMQGSSRLATSSAVVPGKIGQGLNFNGVNDYVKLNTTSGLPVYSTTTPYSVSGWVKGTGILNTVIYGEGDTSGNTPFFLIQQSNTTLTKIQVRINTSANSVVLSQESTAIVFNDKWHHFAWVDNLGTAKLYIDGVQDTANFNYTPARTAVGLSTIGATRNGSFFNGTKFLKGSIDDLRIYSRALSPSEVKQLYNLGAAQMNVSTKGSVNSLGSGLVGWWTFDGPNMKTNVADSSGAGNNQ